MYQILGNMSSFECILVEIISILYRRDQWFFTREKGFNSLKYFFYQKIKLQVIQNNFWKKILPADCADTFLSFQSFEKFDFWKFYGFKKSFLKTKLLINYGR